LGGGGGGAAAFGVWALAKGNSPLTNPSKFWMAIAGGAVVGAAVGTMLWALPASIGFTPGLAPVAGFFVGLAADVVVGAVLGGLGQVVKHWREGGGPEDILSEELGLEIATGAIKGAIFGLVTGLSLNIAALAGTGVAIIAGIVSAILTAEGVWEIAKSGYAPKDDFSFLNVFGSDSNWFKNSSANGSGFRPGRLRALGSTRAGVRHRLCSRLCHSPREDV
jgi:hypothetical protein